MTKFKMNETLENAFIAGLLLTGSVDRAETAILESVRMSCPDDLFSEALFRRTVHYSIDQHIELKNKKQSELDRARSILPFELRCVLNLSQQLRYCYVLRILIGLPREVCAWLLHMDTSQVDLHTCAAMLELPLIQRRERCFADVSSTKKFAVKDKDVLPNNRRASHSKQLGQRTPVAFFTSTRIIQFNKQAENF
jgi:hypothetical protein